MIEIKLASLQQLYEISILNEWMKKGNSRKDSLYKAIQKGDCFVATEADKIVGYITFSRSFFDNWFIKLLYVDTAYRRKGIASQLINEVMKHCVTEKLFVSTNESNEAMKSLLNKLGFIQSGYLDHINQIEREIFYVKKLNHER
ncbi:GNAT family N-acetyltransferase [Bacillus alveayuensis]|jgi:ribosomal protein S18 acetylase RimI-like enzyme|uniref:Ribosomal protein S18 acetylase RimI-like enzyme n=1 Tax=Aeribacillus alveayuensis TaxID=279215 RepID=A0ABT9VMQ0_9BACI|nr:GNAT family N-acetyltransferase [Bacillus alveayuensis]MDQ0162236.1 ribosomal protein S18 acetylase RimI-like enzyme [Bacillus alveayuensis]